MLNNDVDLVLKLLRLMLLHGLVWMLAGCQNPGFLVLPTQNFGNSLNSVNREQEPNFSYDGRYMVFASDRLGYRAIFLFDVQQRRLINLPGLNTPGVMHDQPDINADGRYIVYVSEGRGKPDIYIYDRISRQNQLVTGNILGDIRHPSISGDGRFIAFQLDRNGQWDVEVFDRGPGVRSLPPGAPAPNPSPQ